MLAQHQLFPQMFVARSAEVFQIGCCTCIMEKTIYFLPVTAQEDRKKMSVTAVQLWVF